MFYVYILLSLKDKRLYTGSTNDLKNRFKLHNDGRVASTRYRKPFILIYYEACLNQQDARAREKYLKSGPGKFYLKNRLKRFFLTGWIANDSCTVATEVPVYIRREDIAHMENVLKFKISERPSADVDRSIEPSSSLGHILLKGCKKPVPFPKLLTGHIDFVQIRNGQIHLLDYKPNAAKEKPIEQLTWYALAMSRHTGLRLFEFKCALAPLDIKLI